MTADKPLKNRQKAGILHGDSWQAIKEPPESRNSYDNGWQAIKDRQKAGIHMMTADKPLKNRQKAEIHMMAANQWGRNRYCMLPLWTLRRHSTASIE